MSGLLRGRLGWRTWGWGAELPQAGIDELIDRRKRSWRLAADPPTGGAGCGGLSAATRGAGKVRWLRKGAEPIAVDGRVELDAADQAPQRVDATLTEGAFRRQSPSTAAAGFADLGPVRMERPAARSRDQSTSSRRATPGSCAALATAGVELARIGGGNKLSRLRAHRMANAGCHGRGLVDALQTQSTFTVRNAVVHGLDLARAVKTVGMSRGGETALDTLAGVATRARASR